MRTYAILFFVIFPGLLLAQPPQIRAGNGVLNSASFDATQPIAAGSLFSIFGSKLASQVSIADTFPLSTSRGGVTVRFANGSTVIDAPIKDTFSEDFFASSQPGLSQINAQVPWNLVPTGTTGTVSVTVINNGVASAPASVRVGPASPGIFAVGPRGIIATSDFLFAWPVNAIPGLASRPVKPDEVVVIYAEGTGPIDLPVPDGADALADALAGILHNNVPTPVVRIGGVPAQVNFSGLSPSFPGVNVVIVKIPNIPPGDNVPVQILAGGLTSNTVTIGVAAP
jgi:uncharacterized protein (TIGR03437 family)